MQNSPNDGSMVTRLIDTTKHDWRTRCAHVGSMYRLDYATAVVGAYDFHRSRAGGLSYGSFLVAAHAREEHGSDSSFILLRVRGAQKIASAAYREEVQERAYRHGKGEQHWANELSQEELTDASLDGIECKVLGTFRENDDGWRFHGDIDNYFAISRLMVWKPDAKLLEVIVNQQRQGRKDKGDPRPEMRIDLGEIRFAASEDASGEKVHVKVDARDIVRRRTLFFGMSRYGKSNGVNILASELYLLRGQNNGHGPRIGQLIFDRASEYSRDNEQNPCALHNVHRILGRQAEGEVAVFSLEPEPGTDERPMRMNFYGRHLPAMGDEDGWEGEKLHERMSELIVGKRFMSDQLQERGKRSDYIDSFLKTDLEPDEDVEEGMGARTRLRRQVFAYRGALASAGFQTPNWSESGQNLFGKPLREALVKNGDTELASELEAWNDGGEVGWAAIGHAMRDLEKFFQSGVGKTFNRKTQWLDDKMDGLLQIFSRPNGVRILRKLLPWHDPTPESDFRAEISRTLNREGQLVIVDLSVGDDTMARIASERIMGAVFQNRQHLFRRQRRAKEEIASDVIVFLEEAHHLLPNENDRERMKSIWAQSAKEGSKLGLGMVLSTQAPSSVMPEILSEADNWIVGYLSSKRERNTVTNHLDLGDFAEQMVAVAEPGFVRLRTLSHGYTIPVQQPLFDLEGRMNNEGVDVDRRTGRAPQKEEG